MIKEIISQLMAGKNLSVPQTELVFDSMLSGQATQAQAAAVLTALAIKGETAFEVYAAALAIRRKMVAVDVRSSVFGVPDADEVIFDTCGTGGSGAHTFNVSTAVSFVMAAAGVKIAKHGNRGVSSRSGSADCFEALGIAIDAVPARMQEAARTVGIGFFFAPLYHPAFKEIGAVRREIGVRTIFNMLGPLCNPASATHQLLGVSSEPFLPLLAGALGKLGTRKTLVVYGKDVKDEISLTGPTKAILVAGRKLWKLVITPASFGLKKTSLSGIRVKDSLESAHLIRAVFSGKRCPARDIVAANAGAGLVIAGAARTWKDGARIALDMIDTGKAMEKVTALKRFLCAPAR